MEDLWLTWAKRLQALASTGQHFTRDGYDRERYEEIAGIAADMLAHLGDVPIERIEELVSGHARGYATPRIDVRGALFEDDWILLVREATDGLWTLPGGYADVGLSAAENVVKEIEEEAGVRTRATRLYGLRHKARHDYAPDARDFYKMFFLCERLDEAPPSPGAETVAAEFFPADALPPLSRGRVIEDDIRAAFAFRADPARLPVFD